MNLRAISLALLIVGVSFGAVAQQNDNTNAIGSNAYISDELFIYMHSGAGTNYRIIGSINAGDPIEILSADTNEFTQIRDDKDRTGWIQTKYISQTPSLKNVVDELNLELANATDTNAQLELQVANQQQQVAALETESNNLKNQITSLSSQLAEQKKQLSTQDMAVKKEWFINGAIVLGIGLVLGLVIPKLFGNRRRSRADSWH